MYSRQDRASVEHHPSIHFSIIARGA